MTLKALQGKPLPIIYDDWNNTYTPIHMEILCCHMTRVNNIQYVASMQYISICSMSHASSHVGIQTHNMRNYNMHLSLHRRTQGDDTYANFNLNASI